MTDSSYAKESDSRYTHSSKYIEESKKPGAAVTKKRPNLQLLTPSKQSSATKNKSSSVRSRFLVGKTSASKDAALRGSVSVISGSKDGKKSTGFSASKRF